MNEDLLDAECVIRRLCEQRIIEMREWQNRHPNNQDYSVHFDHPDVTGDIELHIIKRSGRFYIPRSLIGILSYRHCFNADDIYFECSVEAA